MTFKFSKQKKIRSFLKACAMRGTIFCFLLTQSYGQFTYANSNKPIFYIVQKDDTLSQILGALNLQPVYGKSGSLSSVLRCHKFKMNGNLIRPGDTLRLQYTLDPDIANHVQVLVTGELIIAREWLRSQAHDVHRRRLASAKSISDTTAELNSLRRPGKVENNFENLCLKPESRSIHKLRTSEHQLAVSGERNPQSAEAISPAPEIKPPQELSSAAIQEKNASVGDANARSFFLVEATSALTRQDLRTNADGYSELLSKSSPGLSLQWREDVSATWDLDLSYAQRIINQTAPQGSTLSGDSSFTEFAIGGLWNFKQSTTENTSRWKMGPILKYRTEPISARLSESSIRVESPQVMLIGGSLENESILKFSGPERKNLRLKTGLSAWYAPRASQSDFVISDGYGLSADIRLLRPIRRQLDLSGGISYGLSRFKSSLGEHASQQVIFGFGLVYRFGDSEEVQMPSGTTKPSNENGGSK